MKYTNSQSNNLKAIALLQNNFLFALKTIQRYSQLCSILITN
jgi:hypothetical protein